MKETIFFTKLCLLTFVILSANLSAQNFQLKSFKNTVETYDYQEFNLSLSKKAADINPFVDIQLSGTFKSDKGQTINVSGFCDAQDGTTFKLRFMPTQAGKYSYTINLHSKGKTQSKSGSFMVSKSSRKGLLRIDSLHPWHFMYENTGQHYFWNSTTAYWLLGWKDEKIMLEAIERLANLGINRIRVAINGRAHGGSRWAENNVVESKNFTFKLNPWLAKKPDDLDNPEFDVTRFEVGHWQKLDRVMQKAREKGIIISLIFYVDGLDHGCDPFKKANMGSEDEMRYYAYAVARYAAFENLMWDIANEYHLFRTIEWGEKMGKYLKNIDPYQHLISVHGSGEFPFRKSPWVDVVMYQSWDECGGYEFISQNRKLQVESGRILPQINEEYGYEDHYPIWGCGATASKTPNGRNGLNRSQLAWEICMAGAYQTTGERADFGTGAGEDSGGGWINGRGNDQMIMLKYYQIMKETFEKTEYWKLSPANQLVSYGNLCLANIGQEYLIYSRLPHCRVVLPPNLTFAVWMINPRTGEQKQLPDCKSADNGAWQYPQEMNEHWVFILKKK
jgi:hypothetical protein